MQQCYVPNDLHALHSKGWHKSQQAIRIVRIEEASEAHILLRGVSLQMRLRCNIASLGRVGGLTIACGWLRHGPARTDTDVRDAPEFHCQETLAYPHIYNAEPCILATLRTQGSSAAGVE